VPGPEKKPLVRALDCRFPVSELKSDHNRHKKTVCFVVMQAALFKLLLILLFQLDNLYPGGE